MTIDNPTSQPQSTTVTVFVSDPTAEAERVSQALRAAGFQVIDVPLSMLVARVAVQRPHVVIVDADAEGALEAVARLREVPDCESIDLLFTGRAGTLPASLENDESAWEDVGPKERDSSAVEAFAFEGSGFFARPVDVSAIVKKVHALALGGRLSSAPPKRSAPPSSDSPPASAPGEAAPPSGAISSKRLSQPPPPMPLAAGSAQRVGPLSHELENLIAEAEGRLGAQLPHDPALATPEEEIEAVLPEEILAALDAPLEEEEEDDLAAEVSAPRGTTSGGRAETTGTRRPELTSDGSQGVPKTYGETSGATTGSERSSSGRSPPTTELQRSSELQRSIAVSTPNQVSPRAFAQEDRPPANEAPRRQSSFPPPPMSIGKPPPSVLSTTLGSELLIQQGGMLLPTKEPPAAFGHVPASLAAGVPASGRNPPPAQSTANSGAQSSRADSAPPAIGPVILGPGEPARIIAQAISSRATGTLTLESEMGVRRVVLREGDLVTAASGIDAESLLAFLGARGDLPKERVAQLAGRLPPNGRHAGAALVAQGALGQDQMWSVLRAHAEWLIGHCLAIASGSAHMEPEAPGRLRNEPSVFGGSTGAEVFVDAVRRSIDTDNAMRALGASSRVGDGPNVSLLGECALGDAEMQVMSRSRGESVATLAQSAPSVDVAPLLYGLALLGVVDVIRGVVRRDPSIPAPSPDDSALDEEAIRDQVRARLDLVDEGDYFSLLGVPRSATSYEVRRAYLDLRHAFDPSRLLTPRLADLADDVRKIASVLEEAYEILHDGARRERYRRAIEDVPRA